MKEILLIAFLVSNPWITEKQQRQIVVNAVKQVNKETIAKVRVKFKRTQRACSTNCLEPICATFDLFNCWDKKLKNVKKAKLVIEAPYINEHGRYFIGLSDFCSPKKGLSLITAQSKRTNGDPVGALMSQKDLVHEMGHLLGANHSSSNNIMNPAVCSLTAEGEDLHFTRYQGHIAIKSCLRSSR